MSLIRQDVVGLRKETPISCVFFLTGRGAFPIMELARPSDCPVGRMVTPSPGCPSRSWKAGSERRAHGRGRGRGRTCSVAFSVGWTSTSRGSSPASELPSLRGSASSSGISARVCAQPQPLPSSSSLSVTLPRWFCLLPPLPSLSLLIEWTSPLNPFSTLSETCPPSSAKTFRDGISVCGLTGAPSSRRPPARRTAAWSCFSRFRLSPTSRST